MPSQPTADRIPVHDADRDGNLFAWVLALAAARRSRDLYSRLERQAREATIARKFDELPSEAAERARLELPIAERTA